MLVRPMGGKTLRNYGENARLAMSGKLEEDYFTCT